MLITFVSTQHRGSQYAIDSTFYYWRMNNLYLGLTKLFNLIRFNTHRKNWQLMCNLSKRILIRIDRTQTFAVMFYKIKKFYETLFQNAVARVRVDHHPGCYVYGYLTMCHCVCCCCILSAQVR